MASLRLVSANRDSDLCRCFLQWFTSEGEEAGELRVDDLLTETVVTELQSKVLGLTANEGDLCKLEMHYILEAIIQAEVPYVSSRSKVAVFPTRNWGRRAKAAATQGTKRLRAEVKAAKSKTPQIEPYWAPLARAAGWIPPEAK